MRSLLGDYLLQRLQQDIDGTLQLRLFRCLRNAIIDSVLAWNSDGISDIGGDTEWIGDFLGF